MRFDPRKKYLISGKSMVRIEKVVGELYLNHPDTELHKSGHEIWCALANSEEIEEIVL